MATAPDTVTVRADGEATLSFPQDVLDHLGMEAGMVLRAVSTPDGLLLTTANAHKQAVADAADRAEAQYENAFRELAK